MDWCQHSVRNIMLSSCEPDYVPRKLFLKTTKAAAGEISENCQSICVNGSDSVQQTLIMSAEFLNWSVLVEVTGWIPDLLHPCYFMVVVMRADPQFCCLDPWIIFPVAVLHRLERQLHVLFLWTCRFWYRLQRMVLWLWSGTRTCQNTCLRMRVRPRNRTRLWAGSDPAKTVLAGLELQPISCPAPSTGDQPHSYRLRPLSEPKPLQAAKCHIRT